MPLVAIVTLAGIFGAAEILFYVQCK